jgi:hypothetical protein
MTSFKLRPTNMIENEASHPPTQNRTGSTRGLLVPHTISEEMFLKGVSFASRSISELII